MGVSLYSSPENLCPTLSPPFKLRGCEKRLRYSGGLNICAIRGNYFARPYPSFPGPFDRLTALSNVEGLPGESRTYYSDRINRIDRIFFAFPDERQKESSLSNNPPSFPGLTGESSII